MASLITNIGHDAGLLIKRFQENHQGTNGITGFTAVNSDTFASTGTVTTAILASTASLVNNYYTGMIIKFTGGSNVLRKITGYVGSTKTATFDTTDIGDIDSGDAYAIYDIGNILVENGTAVAGTNNTTNITLASSGTVSSVDNFYKDMYLVITGGTGSGQTRRITTYNGATKVATVNTFETAPVATSSTYEIYNLGDVVNNVSIETGLVQTLFDSTTEIDLESTSTASAVDDFYNDMVLRFTGGLIPAKTTHRITDYVGSTQTLTIVPGLDANGDVDASTEYEIYKVTDTNVVAAVDDNTTFTLTSPINTALNYYKGWYVEIIAGPGVGEVRKINSSTTDVKIVVDAWSTTPTTSTYYVLYDDVEVGLIFNEEDGEFKLVNSQDVNSITYLEKNKDNHFVNLEVDNVEVNGLFTIPHVSDTNISEILYGQTGSVRYDVDNNRIDLYKNNIWDPIWSLIPLYDPGYIMGLDVASYITNIRVYEGHIMVNGTLVYVEQEDYGGLSPIPTETDPEVRPRVDGDIIYLRVNKNGIISNTYENPTYNKNLDGWYYDTNVYRMFGVVPITSTTASIATFKCIGHKRDITCIITSPTTCALSILSNTDLDDEIYYLSIPIPRTTTMMYFSSSMTSSTQSGNYPQGYILGSSTYIATDLRNTELSGTHHNYITGNAAYVINRYVQSVSTGGFINSSYLTINEADWSGAGANDIAQLILVGVNMNAEVSTDIGVGAFTFQR